ncbi:helix-turn-helix domain-containing protein [Acidisphaera sp. S103]|uniref:helix-turn-helix domain-containing protein n=1 Tax=Acidisphaera sp. S103 TaxID=1747223 RepID=UPI0020B1721D|nr:XRE family transcriptional regulator [Acidisphaera sp. S103]
MDEVIAGLPADQQQDIAAKAAQLIEDEMTLRDLRKAHELTQTRMAAALHISQDGVSRIEKRSDFLLSTLRSYVEAMGGQLRLIAEFPNRKPVTISGLDSLDTDVKPPGGDAGEGIRRSIRHSYSLLLMKSVINNRI